MVEKFKYKKFEYHSIIDNYDILNAWGNKESFPLSNASASELELLKTVNAVEFTFKGTGGNNLLFDKLFEEFEGFLTHTIFSSKKQAYLFKSEFKSQLSNKVRTYKGVLPRKIESSHCFQEEWGLPDGRTVIVGLVKLNESNISNSIELFYDASTSFIIFSNDDLFSSNFLKDIVEQKMIHGNTSFLNYLKLIIDNCAIEKNTIMRMGGDGGDRYISLHCFYSSTNPFYPIPSSGSPIKDVWDY